MASPDKIDNRRGQRKCFSDTELERWAEANHPITLVAQSVERLGVVEPQHHEPQHVHADRSAPAAQRRAVDLRTLALVVPHNARAHPAGPTGTARGAAASR